MPDFDITIDIYLLLLFLAIAMCLGFLGRSRLIGRKNRKIAELEREMMQAYAELLDNQKDYCELESRVKEGDSPVISIKNNSNKQESPKKPLPGRSGDRKDRATGTD
jgi:hypothetical protein